MERVFRIIKREKVAEILDEISRRLRLPLALIDGEGRPLLNACDASFDPAGQLPPDSTASTSPLYFNSEPVGSLATSASAEKLEAAAFCLENSLRLEAENIDLTAEVVRIYEEQALIYALSSKMGSEMEVDSICEQILEEAENILAAHNVSIMLLDHASNELSPRLCMGRDREAAALFRADASSGLLGRIFQKGEPVTICDVGTEGQRQGNWYAGRLRQAFRGRVLVAGHKAHGGVCHGGGGFHQKGTTLRRDQRNVHPYGGGSRFGH